MNLLRKPLICIIQQLTLTCRVSAFATVMFLVPGHMQSQLTRLTFDELSQNGHFGREFDIHNDYIIVAEPNFGDTAATHTHQGRVHVFKRDTDTWLHDGVLTGSQTKAYSHFGHDVSMHEDDLVIGAPGMVAGSAFIYSRDGNEWQLVQQLTVPAELHRETPNIQFGDNVELYGDWLVISTPGYLGTTDAITRTGAIFIYKRSGDEWTFHQMLLPPDLSKSTQFGNDIELTSSALLISAVKGEGGTDQSGVVFLYRLEGDVWVPDYTFINPSSRSHELYGADVALEDDIIVIGAPMHTEDISRGPYGAAHVYQRFGDTWIRTAFLQTSDGKRNDMFGATVAIADGNIFIGAPRHDEPGKTDAGKVYHYAVQNALWSEHATYSANGGDLQSHMHFGGHIRLHENRLVIGGHLMNNDLNDSGIAYVTEIETTTATEEDPYSSLELNIHPNPVEDIMYMTVEGEWASSIYITIYSQDGHAVDRQEISNHPGLQHSIDVSSLMSGIYFLQANDGSRVSIHKWIKI